MVWQNPCQSIQNTIDLMNAEIINHHINIYNYERILLFLIKV